MIIKKIIKKQLNTQEINCTYLPNVASLYFFHLFTFVNEYSSAYPSFRNEKNVYISLDFSWKMNEIEDHSYELLRRNNLVLPVHLRTILSSLNYSGLHVLSKLNEEDFGEIEQSVRAILADKEFLQGKSAEELKEIFGPLFYLKPEKFQLLPGDKKILRTMAELCTKILSSSPLVLEVKKQSIVNIKKQKGNFSFLHSEFSIVPTT